MMNVLDLFSGIGGFSLGLERAGGFRTVAFCEINPFCRDVLDKHWPGVWCFSDVKEVWPCGDFLAITGYAANEIDVVCGGFPCQDISLAGAGAGLSGERSGLWYEFLRVIGEFRPRYAIIENVSALRSRGLDEVLRGLASIGYDAEWHCIPAAAVGAPHRRDRIWIVAYADGERRERRQGDTQRRERDRDASGRAENSDGFVTEGQRSGARPLAYPNGQRQPAARNSGQHREQTGQGQADQLVGCGEIPDADCDHGRSRRPRRSAPGSAGQPEPERALRDADSAGLALRQGERGYPRPQLQAIERTDWWLVEPNVGRVANGIPGRVDRLRSLGNSIVPQIAEQIGRAILEAEHASIG